MTQDDAFQMMTMGQSVFLTGAAGSGKTHLLNRYIRWLKERGVSTAVTASTGIAATHIGGQTIHSWSGIGIKDQLTEIDLDRIQQTERLVKRYEKTRVIIIDEISMLSSGVLTMVDQVLRAGLRSELPFGGRQVVLCGDFFQLPPVFRGVGDVQFAFESPSWSELDPTICYLTEQFRQDDTTLLSLLGGIRQGNVSEEMQEALQERVGREPEGDVPHLYTHNVDVDTMNAKKLKALEEVPRFFEMETFGSKRHLEVLKRGLLVPEELELKIGATVMFVKNHQMGEYVNGTIGTVIDFASDGYPVVLTHAGKSVKASPESWALEENDKVKAEIMQVPLRLAWAVTIHKSQGMTLDAAQIDLSKTFVPGQGYVALSRVRALEGVYLSGLNDMAYARHPAVAQVDEHFLAHSEKNTRRLHKTEGGRQDELVTGFMKAIGAQTPDVKRLKATKEVKVSTCEKTLGYLKEGKSLKQIAKVRDLKEETIISHIEKLLLSRELTVQDIEYLKPKRGKLAKSFNAIVTVFEESETRSLSQVMHALSGKFSYRDLRFVRLFVPISAEEVNGS